MPLRDQLIGSIIINLIIYFGMSIAILIQVLYGGGYSNIIAYRLGNVK